VLLSKFVDFLALGEEELIMQKFRSFQFC